MTSPPDLTGLLIGLRRAGVDFILVGGMAAVSQGVPTTTFDIDIVPAADPGNLRRLIVFLDSVHARFRGRPRENTLVPTLADLEAGGHCLLATDHGPLDVLGRIGQGLDFAGLLPDTIEIELGGERLRILSLARLVALRRGSPRTKDRHSLPLWEETLRRSKK